MRVRTAMCVAALAIAWAAPAAAQSLVEMALWVGVSAEDGVVEEVRLSTELKQNCERDTGLAGLCDDLEALEGRPGSLAMAELLELGALQHEAFPVKWQGMQAAECPFEVDGRVGRLTRAETRAEEVYVRGFGAFSVKHRSARTTSGAHATWASGDWNGDGDFDEPLCVDAMQKWIAGDADVSLTRTSETTGDAIEVGFLYSLEVVAGDARASVHGVGGTGGKDAILSTGDVWATGAATRNGGGTRSADDGLTLGDIWGYGTSFP